MLTLEQCRQILGEKAKHLTDKEVEELRDRVDALSDVALDQAINELFTSLPHFNDV